MSTTIYDQKQIPAGKVNAAGDYNDNVTAANRTAAALKATADEVATKAVRSVNGAVPDGAGAVSLSVSAGGAPLTQAQIDALPGSGLTPGRILLNTDTDGLEIVGSDGVARSEDALVFGDGSDGVVTISGTTTLTRHMYYRSLTIPAGATLATAGWRVHVADRLLVNGTLTATPGAPVAPRATSSIPGAIGGIGGRGGAVANGNADTSPPPYTATPTPGTLPRQLYDLLTHGALAGNAGGSSGSGQNYSDGSGGGGPSYPTGALGGIGGGGLVVFARRAEGTGVITAPGAQGATGKTAFAGYESQYGNGYYRGGAQGGGGGGGGGSILLVSRRGRRGGLTVTAPGGLGGLGGPAVASSPTGPGGNTVPGAAGGTQGEPGLAGTVVEIATFT